MCAALAQRQQATDWFSEQGVAVPERIIAAVGPGFGS